MLFAVSYCNTFHLLIPITHRKENKRRVLKKNPLKNLRVMNRLNPYDKVVRKAAQEIEARRKKARSGAVDAKRPAAAKVGLIVYNLFFLLPLVKLPFYNFCFAMYCW